MVVKISGRIVSLQHHVKELKKFQKNREKLYKLMKEVKLKQKVSENLKDNLMANQCIIMLNKITSISVESTADQKEILAENDESELNEIMDNFNRLMQVFYKFNSYKNIFRVIVQKNLIFKEYQWLKFLNKNKF